MAEHSSISKNNQDTYYHGYSFTPKTGILCLHDLPSLSPKDRFSLALPYVIRGIRIQWERSGLQMADLHERKNGVWGRERRDRANNRIPWEFIFLHFFTVHNFCG